VPTLTGPESNYPAAAILLTRAGFVPSEVREYSNELPAGRVIGTTPAPSAVPQPYGSPVSVAVSIGPQPVKVPNEVGKSVKAATKALENLGLHVAGPYGPPGSSVVFQTVPAKGASVLPGTTVSLYTQNSR
jgi:serine/threonine-protein kinase